MYIKSGFETLQSTYSTQLQIEILNFAHTNGRKCNSQYVDAKSTANMQIYHYGREICKKRIRTERAMPESRIRRGRGGKWDTWCERTAEPPAAKFFSDVQINISPAYFKFQARKRILAKDIVKQNFDIVF